MRSSLALFLVALPLLGCSEEASSTPGPMDSGAPTKDSTLDAPEVDATDAADGSDAAESSVVDAGPDGPSADARTDAPSGPIVDGKLLDGSYYLAGVTSDDWLLVDPVGGTSVSLVSLRSKAVESPGPGDRAGVAGRVVVTSDGYYGALWAWTFAYGSRKISDSAAGLVAATEDGTRIAFNDAPVDTSAQLTTAWVDGTGKKPITQVNLGCSESVRFVGDRLLVGYCPGKGGWSVGWTDAKGAFAELVAGAGDYRIDAAEKVLFASAYEGAGTVALLSTGATTKVADGVRYGDISPDGTAVVYLATSDELVRTPSTSMSKTILATGVKQYTLSPDGTHVVLAKTRTLDGHYDLHLASALAPSTPTPLSAAVTVGRDAFTADSSTVLWMADYDKTKNIGTLYAQSISGGSPRLIDSAVTGFEVLSGTKLIYQKQSALGGFVSDLFFVDVSSSTAPSTVATNVVGVRVTHDKAHIAYATTGASPGVFVTNVP